MRVVGEEDIFDESTDEDLSDSKNGSECRVTGPSESKRSEPPTSSDEEDNEECNATEDEEDQEQAQSNLKELAPISKAKRETLCRYTPDEPLNYSPEIGFTSINPPLGESNIVKRPFKSYSAKAEKIESSQKSAGKENATGPTMPSNTLRCDFC